MKTARTLCCTLRLLSATAGLGALAAPVGAVALVATLGASLVACDDDSDPKTWTKRLDDPAQRANAIKRLTSFYDDGMTKAGNNASAPEIKALLDTMVEPLTKTYTAGGLDDKTRVDLMKFLAETHDGRTQPAIAKALKDFEMGKTDDEVRVSCESINAMTKAGTKIEPPVVEELWNVFAKFQLSKATSERLYRSLHDAVVAVHDPSYGDKAIGEAQGHGRAKPERGRPERPAHVVAADGRAGPQRAPVHEGRPPARHDDADADQDGDIGPDHPVCAPEDGQDGRAGAHQSPQRNGS